MNITVVGLGHIGLPLAAQYASKGHRVLGCDINPAVVEMVNRGEGYKDEAGLSDRVRETVRSGLLTAHRSTSEAVRRSEVVVIIVPLIVDSEKRVDYQAIESATRDVAAGLRPGTLVVYETTLPVGDTRGRFGPMLEAGSGLTVGQDFFLAFSPERVYVGRIFEDLKRYPKIVGGVDNESTHKAADFYASVLDAVILDVANAETAEFSKLAETTYRDVNIALANEFARFSEEAGVDVLKAIQAANTQPFSHIHMPGIGVGGHCIPVYPYFYANHTPHAQMAHLAREINDRMADHAIDRVEEALGGSLGGRTVAILGYSYREDVKEDAFSVAKRLVKYLRDRGARVLVHDPFYADDELRQRGLESFSLTAPEPLDALVLQARHAAYSNLDLASIPGLKVVLDGRNAINENRIPTTVCYLGIGRDRPIVGAMSVEV